MEEARRLLHGTILPVEHEAGLTTRRQHGTQIEGARAPEIHPPSSPHDPHCHDHAHFMPSCETCRKAQAAFMPYQTIGNHQPASRSFGFKDQMTEADIHRLTHDERRDEWVEQVLLNELIDDVLR